MTTPGLTARQLAARLPGRTQEAVKQRRRHLVSSARPTLPTVTSWLLARTCHRCDRLLPGSAYGRVTAGRYWSKYCRACQRARARAHRAAQVPAVTPMHHGEQWTGAQIELLTRPDLTTHDLAAMLGRTYHAVQSARDRAARDPAWLAAYRSSLKR